MLLLSRNCLHTPATLGWSLSFRRNQRPTERAQPLTVAQKCESLYKISRISLPRPSPTAKPVVLDHAACSITFTTVSPDSIKYVTCAQCEPADICEEGRHKSWTCLFWCSLVNADWSAWGTVVTTVPTKGHWVCVFVFYMLVYLILMSTDL